MPLPMTSLTLPEPLELKLTCLLYDEDQVGREHVDERKLPYLALERVAFEFGPFIFYILQERISVI